MSDSAGPAFVPCPPDLRLSAGPVSLRTFDPATDAERYAQVRMDPASRRWATRTITGDPVEDTRRVLTDMRAHLAIGDLWYLAAELDGRLAGRVSLRMDGAGGAELGFGVHPDARGKGVARSASSLLCRHGFQSLGLTVVRWHSFVGNWPSRRVAWRLGFSFDGTERRRLARAGQPLADAWGGTLIPEDLDRPAYLWLAVPDLDLGGDGPARRLRAPAERDVSAIVAAMADPAARAYLQVPVDYGPAQAEAFLAQIREEAALGTDLTWVVVDREDAVLGCVTLDLREWELGWWGHPATRGRGVVTSAVRRVAHYAFETLRANRLVARCAESNAASARVAELVGMRAAGRLRRGHVRAARQEGTRAEDVLLFDLVPGDLTRTPPG